MLPPPYQPLEKTGVLSVAFRDSPGDRKSIIFHRLEKNREEGGGVFLTHQATFMDIWLEQPQTFNILKTEVTFFPDQS